MCALRTNERETCQAIAEKRLELTGGVAVGSDVTVVSDLPTSQGFYSWL